jgi:hypothetical protein
VCYNIAQFDKQIEQLLENFEEDQVLDSNETNEKKNQRTTTRQEDKDTSCEFHSRKIWLAISRTKIRQKSIDQRKTHDFIKKYEDL